MYQLIEQSLCIIQRHIKKHANLRDGLGEFASLLKKTRATRVESTTDSFEFSQTVSLICNRFLFFRAYPVSRLQSHACAFSRVLFDGLKKRETARSLMR